MEGYEGLDVRAEAWGLESSSTAYNPPTLFALLELGKARNAIIHLNTSFTLRKVRKARHLSLAGPLKPNPITVNIKPNAI